MSVNRVGDIEYHEALLADGIRYQTAPPVCNTCKQQITRANFGYAYLMCAEGKTSGPIEVIECRGCTLMRESGAALRTFIQRYHL